jgi:hypothetical protein
MWIGRGLEGEIRGTTLNATYAHVETPVWFDVAVFHPPQGATDPRSVGAVSLMESSPDRNNWRLRHLHIGIG